MSGDNTHEHDDFWTTHLPLFTANFPSYYTKPRKVLGRFHVSDERYVDNATELVPLKSHSGTRTYVMMQPYVLEPNLLMTVKLSKNLKHYADQPSPIGETTGSRQEGFRQVQVGSAQAWYYHEDKSLVLWECFFDHRFRTHPLQADGTMRQLWQAFESWLLQRFPQATTVATPFNDPSARSINEYQDFLRSLGYHSIAQAVFGKTV